MQQFIAIASTQTLTDSREEILNNDRTIMSCHSGTSFPTVHLEVGMFCFRTDLNQIFELKDLTPNWVLIADLSKTYTNKEYVDAQLGNKVDNSLVVTMATANKILKLDATGKLPADITGNAATATIANGVGWENITGKPTTFTPPVASTSTLGGVKIGSGLLVDGNGILSANAPTVTPHGKQVFTTSGTFTVPSNVTIVWISMVGGGGGGGGGNMYGRGGGGGGGVIGQAVSVTQGQQIVVTVGAGGAGAAKGSTGGTGGTSSFGPYVSCAGGMGGGASASGGSAGGLGGAPGGMTNGYTDSGGTNHFEWGAGGGSFFSLGHATMFSGATGAGITGVGYGGGGSGGISAAGGNGTSGIVIIEW